MQTTRHVLMVRPFNFAFNTQTALSNVFQEAPGNTDPEVIRQKAFEEFDALAEVLKAKGIDVIIVPDTRQPAKPDAVFPNNWASFHEDGTLILYPMFAPNRRLEKRAEIIRIVRSKFKIKNIVDLSGYEFIDRFLEGTGSVVFDHDNRIAYACLSSRTNKDLLYVVADRLQYEPLWFYAYDTHGVEIYHTNVMMCIAEKFAVICLDVIRDQKQREVILSSIIKSGRELIMISFNQMTNYAGNVLALKNNLGQDLLVMSQTASDSFTADQKGSLSKYCELISVPIPTIETIGGGSARCMIAEIFLPPK
jgi:hypothetical protein